MSDDELPPKSAGQLKAWLHEMIGKALIRWGIGAVVLIATGVTAWNSIDNRLDGTATALSDHSREIDRTKGRLWAVERQLADGSGATTVQNHDRRIELLEQFVDGQRTLNGTLTTQAKSTADAVQEVKSDVNQLKKDVGEVKGGVDKVLNLLRPPGVP